MAAEDDAPRDALIDGTSGPAQQWPGGQPLSIRTMVRSVVERLVVNAVILSVVALLFGLSLDQALKGWGVLLSLNLIGWAWRALERYDAAETKTTATTTPRT